MKIFDSLKNKKTSMRHKLFLYMLALAVIVLAFLACGLFFLGHFSSARQKAADDLAFQMRTFDRQISEYFEDMMRMGSALSESIAQQTDAFLAEEGISFGELNDDAARISDLQGRLFNILGTELLKSDSSGAFLLLNATVNSHIDGAEKSKTGLYFQRASLDESDETLLLYRGISELGRSRGVMPHRQWRVEFNTDEIPDYEKFLERAAGPSAKTSLLTDIVVLPGTSERVMNFLVPIKGKDNALYGLCGFEISANYFKKNFAQSTQFEHLTCMLFPKSADELLMDDGFSAGVYGGYYLPPQGRLTIQDIGNGLASLTGSSAFVAKMQETEICGDRYLLVTAYPKEEFDKAITDNLVSAVLLFLLLGGTTFFICVFFSRRFLRPLMKGIEQIRRQEHKTAQSKFLEIDDLFSFLAEQDRLRDDEAEKLRNRCAEQGNLLEQNRTAIKRLAYSRKAEVDPDDYEIFKTGLKTLTKTENQIFSLYLDGRTADEIMGVCKIQQSTLKYHNHNILNKLGVSSRKQMLRYAVLLRQETDETQEPPGAEGHEPPL